MLIRNTSSDCKYRRRALLQVEWLGGEKIETAEKGKLFERMMMMMILLHVLNLYNHFMIVYP